MAYFPRIGPFYDPQNEQQLYGGQDGRLRSKGAEAKLVNGLSHGVDQTTSSHSRHFDGSWTNVVQDGGNLFYSEPSSRSESAYHSKQASYQSMTSHHSRQASYQSTGSHQSSSSDSPRQQFHRQSSQNSNYSNNSHRSSSSHRSSHGVSPIVDSYSHGVRQSPRETGTRQADQGYAYAARNSLEHGGAVVTSNRPVVKPASGNSVTSNNGYGQSGKRKSVIMVPNTANVSDISRSHGVELCEKLFGIKLCHHKHKPPRPNGVNVDHSLRDRKIIVQGVVENTDADHCGNINRGDMLVGLNDLDLTWVNMDDMLRQAASMPQVKLTFQSPVVIGPKSSTPPPVPPHIPLHHRCTPPPRPPPPGSWSETRLDLVATTTGESRPVVMDSIGHYLVAVMYLTMAGQSENSKADVVYQFPHEDNKLVELRGLCLTLAGMLPDVTSNTAKMTCVQYRGRSNNIVYWKGEQDVWLLALPEQSVPAFYVHNIFSDLIQVVQVLYGSVQRAFHDRELHSKLDDLVTLTLYRVLQPGVHTQTVPYCSPLEPVLVDCLSGIRWLRLAADDKISCDEILNEFEAQDFCDIEGIDQDERRKYGVLGSCLFYQEYVLCSHLCPADLKDVHLYLKYHHILALVARQPVDDLVLWEEVYPTHLCHARGMDIPGYREPRARWFLLVVSMRHFLLCTLLEAGSYAAPVKGQAPMFQFLTDQSRDTLAQLDMDDTDIELQCSERLFSVQSGPCLVSIDSEKQAYLSGNVSQTTATPSPRKVSEDADRVSISTSIHTPNVAPDRLSVHTPNGAPLIHRQGSRISFGSNDSSGSMHSLNKIQVKTPLKRASESESVNRSFSRENGRINCDIKLTRGLHNQLLHYMTYDSFEGVLVSPSPHDLSAVQASPTHKHVLYNFYASSLRIRETFANRLSKTRNTDAQSEGQCGALMEEGVMFTCQLGPGADTKRPPTVGRYWVIGRHMPEGHEMYVCLEDGSPQSLLELAFSCWFGLT